MRRRQGFTIVELLVAMALILFIMVILTEAFSAGMETFRQLKAIGDMQEKMRTAAVILRRDLTAEHFDEIRGNRLSDQNLITQAHPTHGYFRLAQSFQASPPVNTLWGSVYEKADPDSIPSTRATETWMAFTVRLRGPGPDDYLTGSLALVPSSDPAQASLEGLCGPAFYTTPSGSSLNSQLQRMVSHWAEVAYFLQPMQIQGTAKNLTTPSGTTQLYALYRRQRLLNDSGSSVSPQATSWPYCYDISVPQPTKPAGSPTFTTPPVNTPSTITLPENRLGMNPSSSAGLGKPSVPTALPLPSPAVDVWTIQNLLGGSGAAAGNVQCGDDILLTNVISFDVKVLAQGMAYFGGTATGPPTPAYFVDLPPADTALMSLPTTASGNNALLNAQGSLVFDTWSTQGSYSPIPGPGWNSTGGATSLPLHIRVLALQITLRVWDDRTKQTRQMTIIQDM